MFKFDLIFIIQLIIYWIVAPLFAIIQGRAVYELYFFIPYLIIIILYSFVAINERNLHSGHYLKISQPDNLILFISILLLSYMVFSGNYGRLVFGDAQLRNSSFGVFEAVIVKACEVAFPLFFTLQINKNKLKFINIVIIFMAFIGSALYFGASKAVLISYFILFIIFNDAVKFTIPRLFIYFLFVFVSFLLIFAIRDEQNTISEISLYFIDRMDGIRLVSEDNLGIIDNFSISNIGYGSGYLVSLLRFFDNELLSDFTAGLISPKAMYLFNSGHDLLDTTITFPSELIIIFGYVPGLFFSVFIFFMLRHISFIKIFKDGIINFSIGYSIIISLIYAESSVVSYILNPIKIFGIVCLLLLCTRQVRLIKLI
jgi:hypothetical protein